MQCIKGSDVMLDRICIIPHLVADRKRHDLCSHLKHRWNTVAAQRLTYVGTPGLKLQQAGSNEPAARLTVFYKCGQNRLVVLLCQRHVEDRRCIDVK